MSTTPPFSSAVSPSNLDPLKSPVSPQITLKNAQATASVISPPQSPNRSAPQPQVDANFFSKFPPYSDIVMLKQNSSEISISTADVNEANKNPWNSPSRQSNLFDPAIQIGRVIEDEKNHQSPVAGSSSKKKGKKTDKKLKKNPSEMTVADQEEIAGKVDKVIRAAQKLSHSCGLNVALMVQSRFMPYEWGMFESKQIYESADYQLVRPHLMFALSTVKPMFPDFDTGDEASVLREMGNSDPIDFLGRLFPAIKSDLESLGFTEKFKTLIENAKNNPQNSAPSASLLNINSLKEIVKEHREKKLRELPAIAPAAATRKRSSSRPLVPSNRGNSPPPVALIPEKPKVSKKKKKYQKPPKSQILKSTKAEAETAAAAQNPIEETEITTVLLSDSDDANADENSPSTLTLNSSSKRKPTESMSDEIPEKRFKQ